MILLNKLFYSTNNILEQLRFYWIIVEREKDEIDRKLMKRLEKEWTGWKKRDKNDNERNLYFYRLRKTSTKCVIHEQWRNEIKKNDLQSHSLVQLISTLFIKYKISTWTMYIFNLYSLHNSQKRCTKLLIIINQICFIILLLFLQKYIWTKIFQNIKK